MCFRLSLHRREVINESLTWSIRDAYSETPERDADGREDAERNYQLPRMQVANVVTEAAHSLIQKGLSREGKRGKAESKLCPERRNIFVQAAHRLSRRMLRVGTILEQPVSWVRLAEELEPPAVSVLGVSM